MLNHSIEGTGLALKTAQVTQPAPAKAMQQRRVHRPSASPTSTARARSRARRGRARGFTVPELLAVVVIIGIFAAAASPSFIRLMRDRRVNRAAMEITGLYRQARTRALGRGTAVMVRWDAATQLFEVREAVAAVGEWPPLNGNCRTTNWNDVARYRVLTDFRSGVAPYDLATVELQNEAGVAQPVADICFTPHGRSFIRFATAGTFDPMTIVPRVTVANADTGLLRAVLIPPSGVARMAL